MSGGDLIILLLCIAMAITAMLHQSARCCICHKRCWRFQKTIEHDWHIDHRICASWGNH